MSARRDLPYDAVSINGRAMEWKGPLWDAIDALHRADETSGRTPSHVVAVERAVETAMRLAIETSSVGGAPDAAPPIAPEDEIWAAYRSGFLDGVSTPQVGKSDGYEAWSAYAEAQATAFIATLKIANNVACQRWNADHRAAARSSGGAEPAAAPREPGT